MTLSARKLVVGNWKMTGDRARVRAFAEHVAPALGPLQHACDATVCVPHPLLHPARDAWGASALRVGAQDCSAVEDGRSTGDVGAALLRDAGTRHVIVGHSERRIGHGESDALVAAKALRVLASGMTPIACIGETAAERDDHRAEAVLRRQLLHLANALKDDLSSVVLAYEPVWAIGSGETASIGMIDDVHGFIAQVLLLHGLRRADAVRVLYGGSVDPRNAGAILERPAVDGVLVGGASQRAEDFLEICRAGARCSQARATEFES